MHTVMEDLQNQAAMAAIGPYADDQERDWHRNVIESLAAETGRTFDDVIQRYEAALMEMKLDARITDFLPILVAKRVKEQCRQQA